LRSDDRDVRAAAAENEPLQVREGVWLGEKLFGAAYAEI
jgi:hypothetical protein